MSGNTPFGPVDSDVFPALLPLATQQITNVSNSVSVSSAVEYSYVEFTAPVTINATTEATANTIVTATAVAFDGATTVMIEFFAENAVNPASNGLTFCLYDGASSIGLFGLIAGSGATQVQIPPRLSRRLVPAAATKTYSIRAFVGGGSCSVNADVGGAGKAVPGYIRITRV